MIFPTSALDMRNLIKLSDATLGKRMISGVLESKLVYFFKKCPKLAIVKMLPYNYIHYPQAKENSGC